MKLLFIGDVFGKEGRRFLFSKLPEIKQTYKPNFIVVNGENTTHGLGISPEHYKAYMKAGINFITLGNHAFDKREIFPILNDPNAQIIRPCNYGDVPGVGYKLVKFNDKKLLIINVMGRVFINISLDNPIKAVEEILSKNEADYVFIDFHGEATSEKLAFALHFDGRVSGICGTHTHVPTADERVLPKGTLYQTDTGMCGVVDSCIGVEATTVIERNLNGFSEKAKTAEGRCYLNATLMDFSKKEIKRIQIYEQ